MEIKRLEKVTANQEDAYYKKAGIVAFQLVEITFHGLGKPSKQTHDTKILKDGRQIIINGDGFVREGLDINSLPLQNFKTN